MNVNVAKWGHSLAVRIPTGIARALHLEDRTEVNVNVENGALVLRPVDHKTKFDLDVLIAGITAENIHDEVRTGASVGNEF